MVGYHGPGMVGSQALIAFRGSDGKMTVTTYNITSYGPLKDSKVWYQVKESSAEFSGGVMRTLVLPSAGKRTVCQVGPSVTGGVPDKHLFQPENLNSKSTLDLSTVEPTRRMIGGTDTWDIECCELGNHHCQVFKEFSVGRSDPAWFMA